MSSVGRTRKPRTGEIECWENVCQKSRLVFAGLVRWHLGRCDSSVRRTEISSNVMTWRRDQVVLQSLLPVLFAQVSCHYVHGMRYHAEEYTVWPKLTTLRVFLKITHGLLATRQQEVSVQDWSTTLSISAHVKTTKDARKETRAFLRDTSCSTFFLVGTKWT